MGNLSLLFLITLIQTRHVLVYREVNIVIISSKNNVTKRFDNTYLFYSCSSNNNYLIL